MLEWQMQEMRELPERVTKVESQILQLRQEIRDAFSAIRSDMRGEIAAAVVTLRQALDETNKAIGDTNTHMRALHEETLSRIATIGEGRRVRRKR